MFQPLIFRGVVNFENLRLTPAAFLPASTAIDSSARRRAAGKGPPPRNTSLPTCRDVCAGEKKHIQHLSLKDV